MKSNEKVMGDDCWSLVGWPKFSKASVRKRGESRNNHDVIEPKFHYMKMNEDQACGDSPEVTEDTLRVARVPTAM